MKRLLAAFAVLATVSTSLLALEPASDRIVVLISVDGLAHYYFDDPKAEMPTIRQLAAEGAKARSMICSLPTVTWPNHTTLVTGVTPRKHGVVGNSYFDREKGAVVSLLPDPLFNKDEIVKTPTIYDAAKGAGLKTAAIIWPASRGAKTLDWTVPDVATNELWETYGTPQLLADSRAAGLPVDKQGEWCKTNNGEERDRLYTQMFNLAIRKYRPNLALLHLIEVDHVEHAKGPKSPEAYAAIKFADDRVREVWDELQKNFPGKATLIVTSDHGFLPYQQQIQPNVLLRKEGLLIAQGRKITGGQVRSLSQGGAAFIYVLDQSKRDALVERLAEMFKQVEGVDLVITPNDFAKHGLANPKEIPQMADIVLSAKSGYSFSDSLTGDLVLTPKSEEVKGTHGYDPNQPDLHATFIAWGAGIQPGAKIGTVNNTDVTPTIATLLGLEMKNLDGKSLDGILKK